MNFSRKFIDHAYVELCMPPNENGEYAMDGSHLHIWPRQTFMMIALPNLDKSFTVTLFMPWQKFSEIKDRKTLVSFFRMVFPDALDLIGEDKVVEDFFTNEKGSLVTVKVILS
jgi:kynurenine 3-monooxygenase